MKLVAISQLDFPLWARFRSEIYPLLSEEFNTTEMSSILRNDLWHCWFIENDDGERIGLVELSLRNIVDGCLSSPVPYIEGLYLIETQRGRGSGARVIEMIKQWCYKYGYTELATDAELTNVRAQQFYEKIGFEEVDRVVEYRFDMKEYKP
ncbi:MAG: GNAT family N-acetyltransferase [Desulfocapsaceae bacterium]|nr:GNAT family N-acetyltransferase [Desulfocapsaceae bacterium]